MPGLISNKYQDFLKNCERFHCVNVNYCEWAQESLEALGHSLSRSAFLSQNLRGSCHQLLGRVLEKSQYYQILFKNLSEDAALCEGDFIDTWFGYVVVQEQQNIYDFLKLHYSKIDGLMLKLCAFYPKNERKPDFYQLENFKKIVECLKETHQKQWSAIQDFHRFLAECRGGRQIKGSEQLALLMEYFHFIARLIQDFKRRPKDNPQDPCASTEGDS